MCHMVHTVITCILTNDLSKLYQRSQLLYHDGQYLFTDIFLFLILLKKIYKLLIM